MVVLVDFSNIAYACYWGNPNDMLGALATKLSTIESVLGVGVEHFWMVEDQPALAKHELFPDYKSGRTRPPVDPRPEMRKYCADRGCSFLRSDGHEADDVLATMTRKLSPSPVTIVSNDRDMWQLLSDNVSIWDHIKKEMVDLKKIEETFGVKRPQDICLVKSLWGDPSDKIPNLLPRLKKIFLPVIVSMPPNSTVQDFINRVVTDPSLSRWWSRLHEVKDLLLRNQELVALKQNCKVLIQRNG